MAFCITFGTHEFTNIIQGAEKIKVRCARCGNVEAKCITRWPWFTVCFIPLIPLATHKYEELACPVCQFHQDIKDRGGVQNVIANGGQEGPPQGHQQGPHQGWGGQQQQGGYYGQQQQGGYYGQQQQDGYYGQGGGGNKPQYR